MEELRQRLKELEDKEKKESKKMADEDALRKIRAVEEQIEYLQKKLAMAKQVRNSNEMVERQVEQIVLFLKDAKSLFYS